MSPRIDWNFGIEHRGGNEELLQKELQAVALVDVVHKDQAFALRDQPV